ncbi:MAG: hypothetical protein UX52_C0005G0031, partial [Candidatus Amesbacteria bacterium GW2011_GWA1_46_35]
ESSRRLFKRFFESARGRKLGAASAATHSPHLPLLLKISSNFFQEGRPKEKGSLSKWRRSVRLPCRQAGRRPHGAPRSPFYIPPRATGKKNERKRKNFTCPPLAERTFIQLKWRNRRSQQEIAFCCPIAPLKKQFLKLLRPILIYQKSN